MKKKMSNFLSWYDEKILFLLSFFLIIFIPLYPKIPLVDIIPGYIVRMRLEDIFILVSLVIFVFQVWRKKATLKVPFVNFIIVYLIGGFLSIFLAVFVIQTIPLELIHVGKSILHFFRYIEYFFLYFLVFNSVKSVKQLNKLILALVVSLFLISCYAIGQKYWYWPVYSTMNREFSKGLRLYLSPHARVQSTFGGHYDLSAYLVIVLPLLFGLSLLTKKKWQKYSLLFLHFFGLWLLIVAASRSSFFSFILAMLILFFGYAIFILTKKWYQKIWWLISRSFVYLVMSLFLFVSFGEDIYERLLQTLETYPRLNQTYHYWNGQRKFFFNEYLPLTLGWKKNEIKLTQPPSNAISTEEAMATVIVESDARPTVIKPENNANRPSDVYTDIPDIIYVATTSASGETTLVRTEVPRTFSSTAMREGLSMGIRKDTLWPQAIAGFKKNIFFGSGYATLNKDGVTHFTEAESTDNNFLRTLGETGLLGFLSFYGFIMANVVVALILIFNKKTVFSLKIFSLIFVASSMGLMLNAYVIDVYAASKVAFTYWSFTGIFYLYCNFYQVKRQKADILMESIKH